MNIFSRLFSGGDSQSSLKNVIDNLSEELELKRDETKLSVELSTILKKEFGNLNSEFVNSIDSKIKKMMNEKSIGEKKETLKEIKKALSETPKKDKFEFLLARLSKNLDSQHEKIGSANEGLKLCTSQ